MCRPVPRGGAERFGRVQEFGPSPAKAAPARIGDVAFSAAGAKGRDGRPGS